MNIYSPQKTMMMNACMLLLWQPRIFLKTQELHIILLKKYVWPTQTHTHTRHYIHIYTHNKTNATKFNPTPTTQNKYAIQFNSIFIRSALMKATIPT